LVIVIIAMAAPKMNAAIIPWRGYSRMPKIFAIPDIPYKLDHV